MLHPWKWTRGKGETSNKNHNLFVFHVCFPGVTSWYDKNHAPFFYLVKRQALKNQQVCMKMLQSVTKHRSDLSTNLGPLLKVLIFQCVTFKTQLIGDCSGMMKLPFSEKEISLNNFSSNRFPPPMKNLRDVSNDHPDHPLIHLRQVSKRYGTWWAWSSAFHRENGGEQYTPPPLGVWGPPKNLFQA